jgi:hypothetical protein
VCFGAAASPRLKCTLRQSSPPLIVSTALRLAKLLRLFRGRTAEKVLIFLGIGALPCLPCLTQAGPDIQPMQSLALAPEDSASPHSKCSRESPRTTSRSRALLRAPTRSDGLESFPRAFLPLPRQLSELSSVLAARSHGQETPGIGDRPERNCPFLRQPAIVKKS